MAIFLDRIDSAPVFGKELPDDFVFWITVFIDSINQTIEEIESILNGNNDGIIAPQKTAAEIAALAVDAPDGTIWYASDGTQNLVIKINGALRQVTTTAYP
ncbi:MAG: hypothetical protein KBB94_10325 [Legionellaceae bacterium]|nr:hypothetical protein [Legionellaceae bacterium]